MPGYRIDNTVRSLAGKYINTTACFNYQPGSKWLVFYDCASEVFNLKKDAKRIKGVMKVAQSAHLWTPLKEICFICDRPKIIEINNNDRIHKDGGPAIQYRDSDSDGIWALNGVEVPQWLAETRSEDLDPKKLQELDNTEVRREFVNKVGAERIYYKLGGKTIDKRDQHGYELIELDFETGLVGSSRLYLKMQNPSINTWHLESVHPDCKTVQDALNYRRYGKLDVTEDWKPEILT